MKHFIAFLRFWYDFIVGDDSRVAAAVAVGLAITLSDQDVARWWVLPSVVVLALLGSLRRAVR